MVDRRVGKFRIMFRCEAKLFVGVPVCCVVFQSVEDDSFKNFPSTGSSDIGRMLLGFVYRSPSTIRFIGDKNNVRLFELFGGTT